MNLSPRMPLTTSPQGPRLSVSLSIPSGLPSPAPTQPPRTLGGQGVPARLHAPRTRTGPTLPRTSPPLFQGIPSTLFLPLKTHPNFNLSAGAPLPSSPPSPTLAVALQSPCALPSPARTQPPRLRCPEAAPAPLGPPQTRTFPPNTSWDLPSPFPKHPRHPLPFSKR